MVEPGTDRHAEMLRIAAELESQRERPYATGREAVRRWVRSGMSARLWRCMISSKRSGINPARIYTPTGSQGTLSGLAVGAVADRS
ncbi:MAG: hypothetical protein R2839_09790 [Thermomicrobiales bacterium]